MAARHRAPMRIRTRRVVASAVATTALAGALTGVLGGGSSPVAAATQSQLFGDSAVPHAFVVPAGVTSLNLELVGGAGGSFFSIAGGRGATVVGAVPVTPGETLTVTVGGQGGGTGPSGSSRAGGVSGGVVVGGQGGVAGTGDGAGGGGYSAVWRGSTLLALAAGGGGAGSAAGGDSGAAGSPVDAGASGGQPGTATAGGAGGTGIRPGQAGSSLQGGDGATAVTLGAGGGGAGLFGGGGGGTGSVNETGGGGGGGGSSFLTSAATASAIAEGQNGGSGWVTLSWEEPDTTAPTCTVTSETNGPPKVVTFEVADSASGLASITVTRSENADTVTPPFTPGTPLTVTITSTKIDQSQPMRVDVRVDDREGNTSACTYDDTPPPVEQRTLTVTITGPGSVDSTPAGIVCPPTCVAPFPVGTPITLTPTATGGGTFDGWTGAPCASAGTGACTFTLTEHADVGARFSAAPPPRPDASVCDAPPPTQWPGFNVIVGTAKKDKLNGTDGPDLIFGLGGDDKISAKDGDDVVCAGDGKDTVSGGDGDDVIVGGEGKDTLNGNDGEDTVLGQAGDDDVKGDDGDDELDGGPGRDKLNGGDETDLCDVTGDRPKDVKNCETLRANVP